MRTWQRRMLQVGGAAAVLAALAFAGLHAFVNPEKVKALAREKAQAAWGRSLAMGDVELGMFPIPWIEARDVAFANPDGSKERDFFRAERITAHLALWPLLNGDVKLRSLEITGGKAVLETSRDGHGNWEMRRAGATAQGSPHPAHDGLLELRELELHDFAIADRRKPDAPHIWHVTEAEITMVPVLHDLHVEADAARDGRGIKVNAKLDDFSHFGEPGAASQGTIELDWGGAKLTLAGLVPLEASLEGQRLHGDLVAPQLGDMLGFFGFKRQFRAPVEAHFEMTGAKGGMQLHEVAATLGKTRLKGDIEIRTGGPKPIYALNVATDDIEWTKALEDSGANVVKGVPEGEVLPDTPLGWRLLEALKGKKGTFEAHAGRVKLGNGLELRNVKTKMSFDDDRLDVASFTTEMLGGTASFKVRADGRTQRGHLDMEGHDLLLERWFKERGRKIPFEGGPMRIQASLDSKGESMKQLAANMSGPVSIRMGKGVYASEPAEKAEATMSSTSGSAVRGVRFECVGANLPFKAGRASREALVGARSDVSRMLTSGTIDFRAQKIDLHGRLKPRSGVGLATIAGDLKIIGTMAKPAISLDQPSAIARIGAAIATGGITAAATAIADVATSDDPCEQVFAIH